MDIRLPKEISVVRDQRAGDFEHPAGSYLLRQVLESRAKMILGLARIPKRRRNVLTKTGISSPDKVKALYASLRVRSRLAFYRGAENEIRTELFEPGRRGKQLHVRGRVEEVLRVPAEKNSSARKLSNLDAPKAA